MKTRGRPILKKSKNKKIEKLRAGYRKRSQKYYYLHREQALFRAWLRSKTHNTKKLRVLTTEKIQKFLAEMKENKGELP